MKRLGPSLQLTEIPAYRRCEHCHSLPVDNFKGVEKKRMFKREQDRKALECGFKICL